MTKEVQFRRGDSTGHSTFTGAAGEITINTDRNVPVVHNGVTAGGFEVVGLAATQTVTNKNLRVGTATSTGTANQTLQVSGGAYISSNLGVAVTNPASRIDAYSSTSGSCAIRGISGPSYSATLYPGVIVGISTNAASANSSQFVASGVGATSGELGIYSFYPTFSNFPTDRGPRRAVDLVAGFSTSTWGTEYFSINVGKGGAANDVGTLTNERFRVDGNGNVGIGTTIPVGQLQISSGPVIVGAATSTGTASQTLQVTGNAHISGNLGIGTTNPSTKLDVIGIGQFLANGATLNLVGTDHTYIQFYPDGIAAGRKGYLGYPNASVDDLTIANQISGANIELLPTSGSVLVNSATSTGTANQTLQVTGGASFVGTGASVGIATTNPTDPLTVLGRVQIQQLADSSSRLVFRAKPGNLYRWNIDNDSTNLFRIFREDDTTTANGVAFFHIRPEGNVLIGTGTSTGTASQLLQVNSGGYFNGNVGIATTNPDARLSIVGPGTSTAGSAPIKVSAGSTFLLATPEQGAIEYDGTTLFATPNTSFGRASIPTAIFTSGAGTNLTTGTEATLQVLFPAANDTITLPIGTYYIQLGITVTRGTTSTTSATLNVQLSGAAGATGTFSGHAVGSVGTNAAASATTINGASIATSTAITAASATASGVYSVVFSGILRITAAGAFQPKYAMSTNLVSAGSASTPNAANFLMIQSINTAGAGAATGAWA